MSKREIGKKRIVEILGADIDKLIDHFNKTSPEFANYVIEHGYGDIYARPMLPDKQKELIAVSCLIGQGNTGIPLKAHLNGMLNVGWTKQEIVEVLIFLTVYAGYPSCVDAIDTFAQVLEEC